MALAITANATLFDQGKITLSVTGASGALPVGSAAYTANWVSGYDGWTAGTDSGVPAPSAFYYLSSTVVVGYDGSTPGDFYSPDQYLTKTVTGLTIGHVYRITAESRIYSGPSSALVYLGVATIGDGAPVAVNKTTYVPLSYEFTATATSHAVRFRRTSGTTGAIRLRSLVVQRYSSTSATPLILTRSDANGTRFVRLTEGAAANSSGAMTAVDYEAAYADVVYRVIDAAGNSAYTGTIQPFTASTIDPDEVQLVAVGTSLVAGLQRVDGFDRRFEFRDSGSQLAIIGRQDPVVTTRSDNDWTKRRGTVTLYARDEADLDAIQAVYEGSRVVLLRTRETSVRDMYHVASAITVRPHTLAADGVQGTTHSGWTYQVDVEFSEIAWPEGDLAGDAWTYADLVADNLAYFDLPAYGTYAAMAAG